MFRTRRVRVVFLNKNEPPPISKTNRYDVCNPINDYIVPINIQLVFENYLTLQMHGIATQV